MLTEVVDIAVSWLGTDEGRPAPRTSRPIPRRKLDGADMQDPVGCPDPIELVLYVSACSAHSAQAISNIKGVLSRFDPEQVKLTVCDLSQRPIEGVEDRITYTPTLVRRGPGPRTFILGHITNRELLLELLADCEAGES